MESLVDSVTKVDHIRGKLIYTLLYENTNLHPTLNYHGAEVYE